MIYDTIIIGGGVSGLAAGYYLTQKKHCVLIVERGKHIYERHREDAFDVANGEGGAGLYSDGKVSFFPSASQLWLQNCYEVKDGYNYLRRFLGEIGVSIDEFSDYWLKEQEKSGIRKKYTSQTLNIEQRLNLIFKMCQTIGKENILVESEVKSIVKDASSYHLSVSQKGKDIQLHATTLIIAGGKHCYSQLQPYMIGLSPQQNREMVEVGIRVECRNEDFDYYDDDQTDVKLIDDENGHIPVRTFCCCRDGIVIESLSYGILSLNGASVEAERRGYSNIGILVRFPSNTKKKAIKKTMKAIQQVGTSQQMLMADYMKGKESLLGDEADASIRNFLTMHFPKMSRSDAVIYHPSIEKAGNFPVLSDTLQLKSENIWVSGDATGIFRGILSSFVSGFMVASCISKVMTAFDIDLQRRFNIKVSASEKRKVVFTAQSKQYFYCRNAVCEYVMRQGCIPVNPFRIFGYFLDDRVDRDLVRNGNNEMISRCDELWVFGPISDGVLFEIYLSRRLGKPVRFFTVETRASEIKEVKDEDLKFESEVHNFKIKKGDLQTLAGNNTEIPKALQMEFTWDE